MLRALLYALAILHLGPGIAFAIVAFGCDPSMAVLGGLCQQDAFSLFLQLTLAAWLALSLALAVQLKLRQRRRARAQAR